MAMPMNCVGNLSACDTAFLRRVSTIYLARLKLSPGSICLGDGILPSTGGCSHGWMLRWVGWGGGVIMGSLVPWDRALGSGMKVFPLNSRAAVLRRYLAVIILETPTSGFLFNSPVFSGYLLISGSDGGSATGFSTCPTPVLVQTTPGSTCTWFQFGIVFENFRRGTVWNE